MKLDPATYEALKPVVIAHLQTLRTQEEGLVKFLNGSAPVPRNASIDGEIARRVPRKATGRKPRKMSAAGRKAVSARMKKYWAGKRKEA